MCVYLYVNVYVYLFVYEYAYVYVRVCLCPCLCLCVCVRRSVLEKLLHVAKGPGKTNAAGETILHASCAGRHRDLSLYIAELYPSLLKDTDHLGHTCLIKVCSSVCLSG